MQKMALWVLVLTVLWGCAAPQQTQPPAAEPADTGASQEALPPAEPEPGPLPQNYAEMIRRHLQDNLIDPDSIRDLEIGTPELVLSERQLPGTPQNQQGTRVWRVPVWFDAKSQSGKYTGRQLSYAEFRDGKIITFY